MQQTGAGEVADGSLDASRALLSPSSRASSVIVIDGGVEGEDLLQDRGLGRGVLDRGAADFLPVVHGLPG